jgi:hypothetical protein
MIQKIRRRDVEKYVRVATEEHDSKNDDSILIMMDDEEEIGVAVPHRRRCFWCFEFLIVFLLLCGMLEYLSLEWLQHEDASMIGVTPTPSVAVFTCPAVTPPTPNDAATVPTFDWNGDQVSSFFDTTMSYEEAKNAMRDFVADHIVPYLPKDRNQFALYEASCGNGWNSWLIIDVLQEMMVQNFSENSYMGDNVPTSTVVTVYGNDPDAQAVAAANALWQQKVQEHHNLSPPVVVVNTICQAESINLSHVPSNAFDVVLTGQLQFLQDPLEFSTDDNNKSRYRQVCHNAATTRGQKSNALPSDDTWMADKLYSILHQRRDDHIGQSVAEMARIAKPGAPILLEHLSLLSFCEMVENGKGMMGGVDRDFWKAHAKQDTYGWNVDPDSVVLENDQMDASRYHVFMLKQER